MACAITGAGSFAAGALWTGTANARPPARDPYDVVENLARVLVQVETEYVEPVERQRLIEGAIKGMVAELDPHSSYLPPRDYGTFQSDTQGKFGGIGVEVDFREESVTIIATVEGSPAERAGLTPGDRIVAIDQLSVRGKSSDELVQKMRGEPGSKVSLSVRRASDERLVTVELTREIIKVSSVAGKLLDKNVAYLRIKQFQTGTHSELLEALGKLRKESQGSISGVLLDLRNNPGGLVDEATSIADELLSHGVIYSMRQRGKILGEVRAKPGGALRRGPLVVLVNEYTASAAELLAGAVQDQRRGTIVGARTFGKGSVQTIFDLVGGAGLKLTTMRYYTPSGRAIQAQGINPTVLVDVAHTKEPGFRVTREADLENHLPAEGRLDEPVRKPPPGGLSDEKRVDLAETHLGVAREVPTNPAGGPDLALGIGYQILTGVLTPGAKL